MKLSERTRDVRKFQMFTVSCFFDEFSMDNNIHEKLLDSDWL